MVIYIVCQGGQKLKSHGFGRNFEEFAVCRCQIAEPMKKSRRYYNHKMVNKYFSFIIVKYIQDINSIFEDLS